jgi:homoserine kinase
MNNVTTHIPGTTANLGPGFDCLGIALELGNRVTVSRAENSALNDKMAAEAAAKFFSATGGDPFGIEWKIEGSVPQSRGLGSSVTVRLGLLHGLNELAGKPLNAFRLFELCAELEGHPDNAAPAAFGGFAVSKQGERPLTASVAERLSFVLLIPDFEVCTPEARRVLPETLDRRLAVESCVNACRVTGAFLTGDYDALRGAFRDHLHQPFRTPLVPFLPKVVVAAENAGAIGGWLSGSGSTICCITEERPDAVAAAMLEAAESPGARTVITRADNRGTMVL